MTVNGRGRGGAVPASFVPLIREHHDKARRRLGCVIEPIGPAPDLILYTHPVLPWRYFNHAIVLNRFSRDRVSLAREVVSRMLAGKRPAAIELDVALPPRTRAPLFSREPQVIDFLEDRSRGWPRDLSRLGFNASDELIVMASSLAERDASDHSPKRSSFASGEFMVVPMNPEGAAAQVLLHNRGFEMPESEVGSLDRTLIDANLDAGVEYLWAIGGDSPVPVGSTAVFCLGATAEVFALSVTPEYRGRGVGTLLAAAAMDRARQAGCTLIYLQAEPGGRAIGLYARLGFLALWSQIAYVYL